MVHACALGGCLSQGRAARVRRRDPAAMACRRQVRGAWQAALPAALRLTQEGAQELGGRQRQEVGEWELRGMVCVFGVGGWVGGVGGGG